MDANNPVLWLLLSVNSVAVILLLFKSYRSHHINSFFRSVVEAMKVGIWVIDTKARTRYVNGAVARLFETTVEAMRGKTLFDFIHPDQFASVQTAVGRRMKGEEQSGEHQIIRKDGKGVWVRYSTSPLYNPRREVTGALAVLTDITEQVVTQQARAETEARYHTIIEHVSDLVYMIDSDTRILFLNPAFTRITGWEVSEWLGKTFYALVHPDDLNRVETLLENVDLNNPSIIHTEVRMMTKSGVDVTLEFRIHPRIEEGQLIGFVGVGRDVSEQKRLALQELQISHEYERTGTLRRFMRHASHDLRTPLSVINSSAYLLRRKLDAETVVKVLPQIEMIESQVMHLNEQINNLMRVSESETKRSQHHFKEQRLDLLTEQVIREQTPAIERKRHKVVLNTLPELPTVLGDEEDLRRVIRHLLLNAISYTPEGGTIAIDVRRDPENVIFTITDTGIGIAADEMRHIFDPFYRVDRARNLDTGGLGLGLTISKTIIEAHGGNIRVESRLGEGTIFIFVLPAQ